MITITVNNSYSQITGLTVPQFGALRKELSYQVDSQAAYFAGGHRPTARYMIDKRGSFPTGLLRRVRTWVLKTAPGGGLQINDKRLRPSSAWTPEQPWKKEHTPYPAQTTAANAAMHYHQGTISMPTGSGKSLVIALLAFRLGLKTLVVVPNLEIKTQLNASLKAVLADSSLITVDNIDSKALQTAKGYDVLILDEAHHAAAKTYQKLNKTAWKDIYYRFAVTATPFRNNTEETMLFEGICGQVIYKLSYQDAVKQGYIVPVEAYYVEVPKQATDAITWQQVYKELVINNQARNGLIAQLLTTLKEAEASTLCLVKEIAHGEILSQMTGIPFVNGQDEESRKYIAQFNSGKLKALIGTSGVIGEGVDTKPCEYVVIAGLGKAKSAFMQSVGRCVRTYPGKETGKVIIFRDASQKFPLKHFNMQRTILKDEYQIKPIKLEL